MKIRKLIKYYLLGESIKDIEVNRILDKINGKEKLSNKEINFLNLYQVTRENDIKDYMYISKNMAYSKIKEFLENGKTVICDLHDRDGKIGMKILNIRNHHDEDICIIDLKDGTKFKMTDNYLYNLIYNNKKDLHSLVAQDEYYEKIESNYDN